MKKDWVSTLLDSQWGRAALLMVLASLVFVAGGVTFPNWLEGAGRNSEYWVSPHLEIYVGLVGLAIGIMWAVAVVVVARRRWRQRNKRR